MRPLSPVIEAASDQHGFQRCSYSGNLRPRPGRGAKQGAPGYYQGEKRLEHSASLGCARSPVALHRHVLLALTLRIRSAAYFFGVRDSYITPIPMCTTRTSWACSRRVAPSPMPSRLSRRRWRWLPPALQEAPALSAWHPRWVMLHHLHPFSSADSICHCTDCNALSLHGPARPANVHACHSHSSHMASPCSSQGRVAIRFMLLRSGVEKKPHVACKALWYCSTSSSWVDMVTVL